MVTRQFLPGTEPKRGQPTILPPQKNAHPGHTGRASSWFHPAIEQEMIISGPPSIRQHSEARFGTRSTKISKHWWNAKLKGMSITPLRQTHRKEGEIHYGEVLSHAESDSRKKPLVLPRRHHHERLILRETIQSIAHLNDYEYRQCQRHWLRACKSSAVNIPKVRSVYWALEMMGLNIKWRQSVKMTPLFRCLDRIPS